MINKGFMKYFQLYFLILIILFNLFTFFYVAPLQQNLSDLGNALGHRYFLILWALSTSIYFFCYTKKLMKLCHYSYRFQVLFLSVFCLFMILSVCIPYLPYQLPQLAKWHTRIAMWGTIGYVFLVFHFLTSTLKTDILFFQRFFYPYCLLIVFHLLLYLLNGGVSTLLETSFAIGMSTYLYIALEYKKKNSHESFLHL